MDDFEVVESPEPSAVNKTQSTPDDLQEDQNVVMSADYSRSMSNAVAEEKLIIAIEEPVIAKTISAKARLIMDDVAQKMETEYKDVFVVADTSNDIREGREIAVTQNVIERSYNLLLEIMADGSIDSNNLTRVIVYVCNIVSREYLSTWQDKQYLVLTVLRKYVANNAVEDNQKRLHMIIDAHVPIIVEKILCPKKKRFNFKFPNMRKPKFQCCKIL